MVQSTINQTGLHRTPSEIKNKNALTQKLFGAAIQYTKNEFGIGAIAYQSEYGSNFVTLAAPYDRYSFTGRKLTNLGLFYNYTLKNMYFYGEAGKAVNGGIATIKWRTDQFITISFSCRNL